MKTQFDSLSILNDYLSASGDGDFEDGDALVAAAEPEDGEPGDRDAPEVDEVGLMRRYALDHFKETVTTSDFLAAVRKDVPGGETPAGVVDGIRTMSSFLQADQLTGGVPALLDAEGDEMIFEVEGSASRRQELQYCDVVNEGEVALFFRVEHFQPSLLKLARGDLSEQFSRSNMTVTTFSSRTLQGTSLSTSHQKCVYVEPLLQHASDAANGIMVLNEAIVRTTASKKINNKNTNDCQRGPQTVFVIALLALLA